jgi:integral membrane protein (TIGR01906 family)
MPDVTLAGDRSGLVPQARTAGVRPVVLAILHQLATVVTILGACVVLLLTPLYVHPALDAAGAPASLGLSAAETHRLSDMTVAELLVGPGDFAFAGPDGARFYDVAEASHMRDVRLVLQVFLALVAGSVAFLVASMRGARRQTPAWEHVAHGAGLLAVTVIALGVFATVAFDTAFELFHRILFPAGNWAFDPRSQRLVQLYPLPFWQITTAALGTLAVAGGAVTWWLARRRAGSGWRGSLTSAARTARSTGSHR